MKEFKTFSLLVSAVAALYFGIRTIASGDPVILTTGAILVAFGVCVPLTLLLTVFFSRSVKPVQPEFFIELFRQNVDQYPALLDQAAVMLIERITEIDKHTAKALKSVLDGFDGRRRVWVRPPVKTTPQTESGPVEVVFNGDERTTFAYNDK